MSYPLVLTLSAPWSLGRSRHAPWPQGQSVFPGGRTWAKVKCPFFTWSFHCWECWSGHPQGYRLNSSFLHFFGGMIIWGFTSFKKHLVHYSTFLVKRKTCQYLRSLSRKSRASGETRCWFSECTKRSHLENNSNVAIQWLGTGPRLTFSCCVFQGCPRSVDRALSGTCPSTRRALLCQAPALDRCIDMYIDVVLLHPTLRRWGQAHKKNNYMFFFHICLWPLQSWQAGHSCHVHGRKVPS